MAHKVANAVVPAMGHAAHRVEVARAALGAGTKVSSWAGRESQILEEKDYPDGQFQSFGDLIIVALNSLI